MKVFNIVGARPQFIKAALVSAELKRRGCDEVLIHTGQHYDYGMSGAFFKSLDLREPDYNLDVRSASHAIQTGEIMKRLEPLIESQKPDWILVYGDTNTTLAAAIVAAKLVAPLAHIEAGLRSFNRKMPEEINRIVADHLADLHFVPNERALNQLALEGIHKNVVVVGDLMVDLLAKTVVALPVAAPTLRRLGVRKGEYAVATVHRAANTDDPSAFGRIVQGLRRLKIPVVFPIHPRTQPLAERFGIGDAGDNVIACEPLAYHEMLELQRDARVILTDSGGMQKEAYELRVPCVTLRDETEWIETLENNWNVLVGANPDLIEHAAGRVMGNEAHPSFYGSGKAAEYIVEALTKTQLAEPNNKSGFLEKVPAHTK